MTDGDIIASCRRRIKSSCVLQKQVESKTDRLNNVSRTDMVSFTKNTNTKHNQVRFPSYDHLTIFATTVDFHLCCMCGERFSKCCISIMYEDVALSHQPEMDHKTKRTINAT